MVQIPLIWYALNKLDALLVRIVISLVWSHPYRHLNTGIEHCSLPGSDKEPSPADYDKDVADKMVLKKSPSFTHQFRREGTVIWASKGGWKRRNYLHSPVEHNGSEYGSFCMVHKGLRMFNVMDVTVIACRSNDFYSQIVE